MKVLKEYTTSKGGVVKVTSTGLIHTPSKGFYSGAIAETGVMPVLPIKRGRGRPRKDRPEDKYSGAKKLQDILVGHALKRQAK